MNGAAITVFDTSILPCCALRDYERSGILHFLSKQNTMHWSWRDLIPPESRAIPALQLEWGQAPACIGVIFLIG